MYKIYIEGRPGSISSLPTVEEMNAHMVEECKKQDKTFQIPSDNYYGLTVSEINHIGIIDDELDINSETLYHELAHAYYKYVKPYIHNLGYGDIEESHVVFATTFAFRVWPKIKKQLEDLTSTSDGNVTQPEVSPKGNKEK